MIEQMFASTPQMASTIGAFSDACEATYFGSGGGACPLVASSSFGRHCLTRCRRIAGRCDDDYWRAGLQLITQKCPSPGVNQVYQAGHLSGNFRGAHRGRALPRYQANEDDGRAYANFLAVCQAAPGGGGH